MFGLGDVWGFILAPEELFRPCCQDNDSLIFLGQQTRLAVFYLLFFFFCPPVADIATLVVSSAYRMRGGLLGLRPSAV